MGCIGCEEILEGIAHLEIALKELGHPFQTGAGVEAAKKIFDELPVTR
jgi:aspartate aminotransferase-like enzyme